MSTDSVLTDLNSHLLGHILSMTKTHTVYAADDICDEGGNLLLAKGKEISERLNERLLVRKLQRPLETSLIVENGINVSAILVKAQGVFTENASVGAIANVYSKTILKSISGIRLCPAASLLLTSLDSSRPHAFTHCVEVAILAAAFGIHLQLQEDDIQRLVVAGLLHDIGELYINSEYIDQKRALTPSEWKHIAVHPKLSQMAIENFTNYPKSLANAVAEHHERINGSGYPHRMTGARISRYGEILGIAELLSGILRNKHHPIARATLSIKLIPGEFAPELVNAMLEMRRISNGMILSDDADVKLSPDDLIQKTKEIGKSLTRAINEYTLISQCKLSPIAKEIIDRTQIRIQQLTKSLAAVGLGDYFTVTYLDTFISDGFDEMCLELDIIASEIEWRLHDIAREISLKLEDITETERTTFMPLVFSLNQRHEPQPITQAETLKLVA